MHNFFFGIYPYIALAVMIYGAGLPAFVLQKVLQPLYFAREDTRTPLRYALVSMVVNAAVAIGLAFYIGWLASAVATTLAAWVQVALLAAGRRSMGETARFDARFTQKLWRISAAAGLSGGVMWAAMHLLTPMLAMPTWRYGALAALIAAGIMGYFALAQALGALSLADLRASLRRRR